MKPIDEIELSAFLDGELDASRLRQVEEALQADPELRGLLHGLSQARTLVAELPRPAASPDTADQVLRRIRRSQALRRWGAVVTTAAAAAVITGLSLSLYLRGTARDLGGPVRIARTPTVEKHVLDALPDEWTAKAASIEVASGERPEDPADADRLEAEDRTAALFAPGSTLRWTIPVRSLDEPTIALFEKALQDLVWKDARFGEFRGVDASLLEPGRPGSAVAFALILDGPERERFRSQLSRIEALAGPILAEAEPIVGEIPDLVVKNAEIRLGEGRPGASLLPGHQDKVLSLKVVPRRSLPTRTRPVAPTPRKGRENLGPDEVARADAVPDRPVTILLWLVEVPEVEPETSDGTSGDRPDP